MIRDWNALVIKQMKNWMFFSLQVTNARKVGTYCGRLIEKQLCKKGDKEQFLRGCCKWVAFCHIHFGKLKILLRMRHRNCVMEAVWKK